MRSTHDHEDQYLTRSSWSRVDRNQKSIIVLLNDQEFPSQKLITSDAITAFLSRPAVISFNVAKNRNPEYTAKHWTFAAKSDFIGWKECYAVADWSKAKPRIHRLRAFAVNSLWGTLE